MVAVVGDSTFLHMGMQGLLDIVYNQGNVHSSVLLPASGRPDDLGEHQED